MLQPRNNKKWTRSEKWILGVSLPAILGLSWWSFQQPNQLIDISPFKMKLAQTHFGKLTKPTILRAKSFAYAQRKWPSKNMVPFRALINLSHDGPQPNWWGHENMVWTTLWFTSKSGVMAGEMAGRTAIRFDRKTQCYVVHYECLMPDKNVSFGVDTCTFKGAIQFSPLYTNMKDPSSPTSLQQRFLFSTDVKLDS